MTFLDILKGKGRSGAQEAAQPISVEYGPKEFGYLNLRHWKDLNAQDLDSLKYGDLKIVDTVPQSLTEHEKLVPADEFATLRRYSLAVGICRTAHFEYKVFDYNCAVFLDRFNFDDAGTMSFKDQQLSEVYTEVNALWQNAIVSGQKFLRWMEHDLKERFGEDSDAHISWKDAFAEAADRSLACDICFRMPGMVERDFLFVNLVNVDFANSRTGFAMGWDYGFMDHDMGEKMRDKFAAMTKARKERGLDLQVSAAELARTFRAQVALMYAHYLTLMMEDADRAYSLVEELSEGGFNCVVRTRSHQSETDHGPLKIAYRMPAPSMVEYYQAISAKLRDRWA